MSTDANFNSPRFTAEEPQRGMSGAMKVLLGLGIGCGVIVILCCGTGYFFFRQISQGLISDPNEIRALTNEITAISIPDDFTPQGGLKVTGLMARAIPFTGMVIYVGPAGGSLVLMEFDAEKLRGANDPQAMQQKMNEAMAQQGRRREGLQTEKNQEKVQRTIRGQPAEFVISSGTLQRGGEGWEVKGSFLGKGGPAFLMMSGSDKALSKEKIMAVIDSIK